MDIIFQAITKASQVWEQAIAQESWHHALFVATYLGAAWLCLLNGHVARAAREAHVMWYAAAALLCGLGLNSVLQGDLFLTHSFRELAKLAGWYGQRRELQYLMIVMVVAVAGVAVHWWRSKFAACELPSPTVAWGLAALLALLAIRTVSAHGTDALINLRIAGISAGRMMEFAGIGLVSLGSMRCLRLR